ncbi:MAG: transglycosylase family protein [Actinomycetota bacterium]|nr:transglycosylase family protein [Actinomycetota bacterium]
MTHFSKNNNFLRNLGMAWLGLAVLAMVAMLILSSATTAFGDGGIGTGDGDGDGNRYTRTWDDFSRKDKRWAKKTSECESGGDPHIHSPGGDYHGAFQFSPSTWKTSPMSPGGDPHKPSWKTQAVVAVKLKHRDGAGHWPVCG